jgi:2'-5' RNA ligase
VLDESGSFRRAGVAWAGTSSPPPELIALQAKLEARLRGRGFAFEERPFAPHVTLARRTGRALARVPIAPIAWRARSFTLVRSEAGTGRYVVEERWELRD